MAIKTFFSLCMAFPVGVNKIHMWDDKAYDLFIGTSNNIFFWRKNRALHHWYLD